MTRFRCALVSIALGLGLIAGPFALAAPRESFAPLVARLSPSVVTVTAYAPLGPLPQFPPGSPMDVAQKNGPKERSSVGSGFVVDASGVVVTNNHVVDGAVRFELVFSDGAVVPATLVGRDEATDLAVLRARAGRPLAAVGWANSDAAQIGDWMIAIGNPFGLGGSVSIGVLSGRNRDLNAGRYDEFLQTDAAINQGNSGGPLFDSDGQVVGVNTAIASPTGGGSVGVGFAVPSNLARRIVRDLVAFGEVRRGYIGIRGAAVDGATAAKLGVPGGRGAVVMLVEPRSPGAVAGLKPGDVVLAFNGVPIRDARALTRAVADAPVGRAVPVSVWRNRAVFKLSLVPSKLVEGTSASPGIATSTLSLGMTMANVTPDIRKQRGIGTNQNGSIVNGIAATSPARNVLMPGDLVVEVQSRAIGSAAEVKAALDAEARRRSVIIVRVLRNGKLIYRAIPVRR